MFEIVDIIHEAGNLMLNFTVRVVISGIAVEFDGKFIKYIKYIFIKKNVKILHEKILYPN